MTQTPLGILIQYMEDHSMTGTGTYRKAKALLVAEKTFAQEAFEAGERYGADELREVITSHKNTEPDFETYYSKYKL